MGFVVGLIHNINAVTVAKFVDILAVGIVGRAQKIDVSLFHQSDVLFVGFVINITSRNRMMVVTVYATEFHIFAVDFEHLANDLHFLDTCLIIKMFGALLAVEKFDVEGIEIWLFSRPNFRILDVGFNRNFNSVIGRDFLYNILIITIVDIENYLLILHGLCAGVAYEDFGVDVGGGIVAVQNRNHLIISNMHSRAHPKFHAPKYAAQPPHILVFEVTAIAPTIYLHCNSVFALAEKFCDVKFGRRH